MLEFEIFKSSYLEWWYS